MLGPILDTGIALMLMYLVLSLICTALQEWVAKILELRSNNLEKGLKSLMSDQLARDFLQSPQLIGLNRAGPRARLRGPIKLKSEFGISNIPADRFISYLFRGSDVSVPTGVAADDLAAGLARIDAAIDAIPSNSPEAERIKALLKGFKVEAAGEIEAFETKVKSWFDESMSTVSGWYARRIQEFLLGVSFFVAVGLNANTFQVADKVWNNDELRVAMVAAATKIVEDKSAEELEKISSDDLKSLQLDLPIGWPEYCGFKNFADDVCTGFNNFMIPLFGWLITAVALSLGAKFWFDWLKTLINLRGDGSSGTSTQEKAKGTTTV